MQQQLDVRNDFIVPNYCCLSAVTLPALALSVLFYWETTDKLVTYTVLIQITAGTNEPWYESIMARAN